MSPRWPARRALDGDSYVIDGEKTWISNGGIADVYTLFARTGEAPGARGISAFVVFPDDPGFSIADRIDVIAPHPLATLRFEDCRIPPTAGSARRAAASRSRCRRSTSSALRSPRPRSVSPAARSTSRLSMPAAAACSAATLADLQLTQAALGDMATEIDAAALLTGALARYR